MGNVKECGCQGSIAIELGEAVQAGLNKVSSAYFGFQTYNLYYCAGMVGNPELDLKALKQVQCIWHDGLPLRIN